MSDSPARCATRFPIRLRRRTKETMLLPYYHLVSDEWVPHVSPLYRFRNTRKFRNDLEWFLNHGNPLGLTEFLNVTTANAHVRPNAFFLTFDDGFKEVFEVIRPILLAKGVPAFFFVTSATIDNQFLCLHQKIALILDALARESADRDRKVRSVLSIQGVNFAKLQDGIRSLTYRQAGLLDEVATVCGVDFGLYLKTQTPYLSSEQIAILLKDGFGVGAHSIDHPLYSEISFDEQIRQTRVSMKAIADRFALPYRLFAFPHSDASVSVKFFREICRDNGIQATFGTSAPHFDCVPRSFQRFSMEKSKLSAGTIVALQSARRIKQRLTGRTLIERP